MSETRNCSNCGSAFTASRHPVTLCDKCDRPATRQVVCQHPRKRDVGSTIELMGTIIVYWCPDCGAIKRTMVNWKYTDYPWELPAHTKP